MVPSPSVDPSEYLSVLVLVNYASALANTMIFYNQDWVWPLPTPIFVLSIILFTQNLQMNMSASYRPKEVNPHFPTRKCALLRVR